MHQRRGLKSVPGCLLAEVMRGQAAQIRIDERDEAVARVVVTVAHSLKKRFKRGLHKDSIEPKSWFTIHHVFSHRKHELAFLDIALTIRRWQ